MVARRPCITKCCAVPIVVMITSLVIALGVPLHVVANSDEHRKHGDTPSTRSVSSHEQPNDNVIILPPTVDVSDSQDAPLIAEFVQWVEANIVQGDPFSDSAIESERKADTRTLLAVKIAIAAQQPRVPSTTASRMSDASVLASRHFSAGEAVLVIPPTMQLTTQPTIQLATGHGDSSAPSLLQEESQASHPPSTLASWLPLVSLACSLLRQKALGAASPWRPYLLSLPSLLPSPVFLPDHIVEQFQAQEVKDKVVEYRQLFTQLYLSLRPEAMAGASEADFQWALSMVLSRAVEREGGGRSGGGEKRGGGAGEVDNWVLLPLADMIRRGRDANVKREQLSADGSFIIRAARDIEEGEELLLSYDFKDTTHLLLTHGIVAHRNPYDRLVLCEATADGIYSLFQRSSGWRAATEDDDRHFRAVMNGLLESMVDEVPLAKGRWEAQPQWGRVEEDSPEYDVSDDKPFAVWADGGVDPRLFLNLMGIRQYVLHGEYPVYDSFSFAAFWFGWLLSPGSCSDLAIMMAFTPNELESFKAVAAMLVEELRGRLKENNTTLQQDEILLSDLQRCEAPVADHGEARALSEGAECREGVLDWGHALQMAIEYRIERKRLIHRVIERLAVDCAEMTVAVQDDEVLPSGESLSNTDDDHESDEL